MVRSNAMREKRSPIAKRAAALGLGLILIFSAAPALCDDSADGPSTLDRTFDAIVLRRWAR